MSNNILNSDVDIRLIVFNFIFVLFIFDCNSVIFYIDVVVFYQYVFVRIWGELEDNLYIEKDCYVFNRVLFFFIYMYFIFIFKLKRYYSLCLSFDIF